MQSFDEWVNQEPNFLNHLDWSPNEKELARQIYNKLIKRKDNILKIVKEFIEWRWRYANAVTPFGLMQFTNILSKLEKIK